jgi:hypothetical protein
MHNRFLGPIRLSTSCVCYRIPNFPWRSHALWFIDQMRRWGYVGADVDPIAASAIFRPDVFVQAAGPLGLAVPEAWVKSEGSHSAVWLLRATPAHLGQGTAEPLARRRPMIGHYHQESCASHCRHECTRALGRWH